MAPSPQVPALSAPSTVPTFPMLLPIFPPSTQSPLHHDPYPPSTPSPHPMQPIPSSPLPSPPLPMQPLPDKPPPLPLLAFPRPLSTPLPPFPLVPSPSSPPPCYPRQPPAPLASLPSLPLLSSPPCTPPSLFPSFTRQPVVRLVAVLDTTLDEFTLEVQESYRDVIAQQASASPSRITLELRSASVRVVALIATNDSATAEVTAARLSTLNASSLNAALAAANVSLTAVPGSVQTDVVTTLAQPPSPPATALPATPSAVQGVSSSDGFAIGSSPVIVAIGVASAVSLGAVLLAARCLLLSRTRRKRAAEAAKAAAKRPPLRSPRSRLALRRSPHRSPSGALTPGKSPVGKSPIGKSPSGRTPVRAPVSIVDVVLTEGRGRPSYQPNSAAAAAAATGTARSPLAPVVFSPPARCIAPPPLQVPSPLPTPVPSPSVRQATVGRTAALPRLFLPSRGAGSDLGVSVSPMSEPPSRSPNNYSSMLSPGPGVAVGITPRHTGSQQPTPPSAGLAGATASNRSRMRSARRQAGKKQTVFATPRDDGAGITFRTSEASPASFVHPGIDRDAGAASAPGDAVRSRRGGGRGFTAGLFSRRV